MADEILWRRQQSEIISIPKPEGVTRNIGPQKWFPSATKLYERDWRRNCASGIRRERLPTYSLAEIREVTRTNTIATIFPHSSCP